MAHPPKGTPLLHLNEASNAVWAYHRRGQDGSLRLFSVEMLLQPGSSQIDLYEWAGLDSWVDPSSIRSGLEWPLGMPGYAAISHVWDPSDEVRRISQEVNRPLMVDTEKPTPHIISWHGLIQAATAAKHLGCEYLWLDLLCLDQLCDNDKKLQIKNMHNVYRSATAVLVMFGGVAAAQGLDKPSTWINRAWTLQEATLCGETYGLVNWPLAGSFFLSSTLAEFNRLPGGIALVRLGALVESEPGAPLGIGTHFNIEGDMGQPTYLELDIKFQCLGAERPAILALASVIDLQLSQSHKPDPDALQGAAWRSMWLRTSTKQQDLVFSMMHLLGTIIEVDYSKSLDDLIFKLITKTSSIPAWLTIGYDIPINPASGLIPKIPTFTPHSIPTYNIDGKIYPAEQFVCGDYRYHEFDIVVKSSSAIDGHLICARILDVENSSKEVRSKENSSYFESELRLSSSKYKLNAKCQFKGRMGTLIVVVGGRQVKDFSGYWHPDGHPFVYLLGKNDSGVWQKFGSGTLDESLIWQRSDLKRIKRRHLRVGGSPGAEVSPCDCDGGVSLKNIEGDLLEAYTKAEGGKYGTALQEASFHGDYDSVRLLIENGANVNAKGGLYGNALQAASRHGNKKVVKLLIKKGAQVNAQGGKHFNALKAALAGRHEKTARLLIKEGADVNVKDEYHRSALHESVSEDSENMVQLLLENGAEVNAEDGELGNALQAACWRGKLRIARFLIDKGADINASGGYYGTALQAASFTGSVELVGLLIDRGSDVNFQGGHYGHALQAASYTDHDEVVDLLIKKGADVNAQGGNFGNSLQAACRGRSAKAASVLINNGANVNAERGDHGDEEERKYGNPLQAAASHGDLTTIRLLIDHGADVSAKGGLYGNALQYASHYGNELAALELIIKGANVNTRGGYYDTALQAAVAATYGGNYQVARTLIENGADVNMQGGPYGNALQAASYNGDESIVRMLIDSGAHVNARGGKYGSALQAASHCRNGEIVRLLVEKGADINIEDAYQDAFMEAYYDDYEHVVQRLISKGANVNAEDDGYYGNVLQAASQCADQAVVKLLAGNESSITAQPATFGEHEKVVRMLIENGADVNKSGGPHGNALQAASYDGNKDVMRLLIASGANVNAQGGKFGTALRAACSRGYEPVVQLLLENGANANSNGGKYGSLLGAAALGGHDAVVKLLLEYGASTEEIDAQGRNILHMATNGSTGDRIE
jgi:ankyrin repeat protein